MFTLLKYVIFALGLLTAYVLIENFLFDRGEEQTINDSVNQVVSEINEVGENISNEYVKPAVEEINASMEE